MTSLENDRYFRHYGMLGLRPSLMARLDAWMDQCGPLQIAIGAVLFVVGVGSWVLLMLLVTGALH